jgi:hypothetical protein
MARLFSAALFIASMVIPALAETPPPLPATAKKLAAADITALYDGSMVTWHNFAAGGIGAAIYDLKKKVQYVIYDFSGNRGSFTGKIRVKDDTFCYVPPKSKEVCVSVYTDGGDIYEVDSAGVVSGKNKKQ